MTASTVVGSAGRGRPTDGTDVASEPHPRVTISMGPKAGGTLPPAGDSAAEFVRMPGDLATNAGAVGHPAPYRLTLTLRA